MTINRPIPFDGTDEEREANRRSHTWASFDGEIHCWTCDHKIWHQGASYPCGVEAPRETVEVG